LSTCSTAPRGTPTLRDAARSYVLDGLADPDATLVLDDTQAIKRPAALAGAARAVEHDRLAQAAS
jgi:hypothetical protein